MVTPTYSFLMFSYIMYNDPIIISSCAFLSTFPCSQLISFHLDLECVLLKTMTKLVQDIFGMNLAILRIFGFYPPRNYSRLYRLYSVVIYCLFITLTPVLSSLYLFMDPDINLNKIADSAFIICESGCFVIKIIPFLINTTRVDECISMIEHSMFMTYTTQQEDIIKECRKVCKLITWFLLSSASVCIATWSTAPLFEKNYKLPIGIWLPYDFSSSFKLYFISFVYVTLGIGSGAILNGSVDPLIAGLAYYVTSQVKILKDNLQHLIEYADKVTNERKNGVENYSKLKGKLIYDQIKFCVQHHHIIIKFVEMYQTTFSSAIFAQFCSSVVVICICCLKISQAETFSMSLIFSIVFLLTMLSEIFLFCYFGSTLFEESNTLVQAIYMGKWYDYDLKSRKALIILMERERKPLVVTAGKILDLSLETFTMILRRAYSLLAVLKNY